MTPTASIAKDSQKQHVGFSYPIDSATLTVTLLRKATPKHAFKAECRLLCGADASTQSGAIPGAIRVHTPCIFYELRGRNCAIMTQLRSQTLAKRPDNTR
jgi:hypothetical protein